MVAFHIMGRTIAELPPLTEKEIQVLGPRLPKYVPPATPKKSAREAKLGSLTHSCGDLTTFPCKACGDPQDL